MKRIILGVAAALFLSAGQAAADGLPTKSHIKAPEAGVSSWTGFYVGVGVGAGAVTHNLGVNVGDYNYCNGKCYSWEHFGFDGIGAEGFFGTVSIGYDRQIHGGRWVLGVFADYDFGSSISTDVSFGQHGASIDQTYAWAIGGRLGYLVNPSTLFYGTVGYTETEFELNAGPISGSQSFGGYFVGAGLETKLRDSWTLKLEYRFSQFEDVDLFDKYCFNLSVEPSEHSARLVLNYRFGDRN